MRKLFTRRNEWVWLLFLSIGWLTPCLYLLNWTFHARVNMLVRGYVLCQVVDPDRSLPEPEWIKSIMHSKLVYKNGACVGYLDRYGGFTLQSDTVQTFDQGFHREFVATVVMVLSGLIFFGVFVIWILIALVRDIITDRKAYKEGLIE